MRRVRWPGFRVGEGLEGVVICRTLAEVYAAADADPAADRPLTQAQADYVAALLAAHIHQDAA